MAMLRASFDGPMAVVGDIHGCAAALRELLEKLGDLPIVILGDVGDRGPDTPGVIDLLLERRAIGVKGNHDDWLLSWAKGEGLDDLALDAIMGGRATLASYQVQGTTISAIEAERWRVPKKHQEFLESLADVMDLTVAGTRYWVLHGGVPKLPEGRALSPEEIVPFFAEKEPWVLRSRRTSMRHPLDLGRTCLIGHTPVAEPIVSDRLIALDTGAGTTVDGRLTAIVLPERRLVSVPAPGTWDPPKSWD